MKKLAYSNQLSFQVTDEEKEMAKKALNLFNITKNKLKIAEDYLNILNNPFSNNPGIPPEKIYDYRPSLRRFRDVCKDNFSQFKVLSFKCVKVMNNFSFDTQTIKLIKSFISSVEELESIVHDFLELFSDLKNKEFQSNAVATIGKIKSKCDEIIDLINERINQHIKNNILSTNWVNDVGDELNIKLEKKLPIMLELSKHRRD